MNFNISMKNTQNDDAKTITPVAEAGCKNRPSPRQVKVSIPIDTCKLVINCQT